MPTSSFHGTKLEVLLSEDEIRRRVGELGRAISKDYAGKPLVAVGILKGSFIFMADLVRAIDLPLSVDFLGLSSYEGTESTGVVQITSDLAKPIEGKNVLIVEDIVDTGLTMRYLLENLTTRKPASVKVCALLEKPARAKVKIPVDYKGFTIEDKFVVGYGLDWDGRFRNLPYIGVVVK